MQDPDSIKKSIGRMYEGMKLVQYSTCEDMKLEGEILNVNLF